MNGRNAKWIITATCLLVLAGCGSSPEERLYEAFKCGKVATLLEQEKDGDMALKNAEPYMRQMEADGRSPDQVAMEMNQRFQDDVPIHRLALGGQMTMLSTIYQSDSCQALYKPGPGLTQANQINLAGCEVPAGLTPEEAERIECAKVDPVVTPVTQTPDAEAETAPPAEADIAAAATDQATARVTLSDAEIIEAAIAGKAKQDGGSEYTDVRKSAEGDLNGDGTPDLAVLYTLEGAGGGNNAYSYLAAFVRSMGQLKLADTIVLSGSAQDIALKDGVIHLKLLSPGPGDSDCCPSVVEDAVYVLHGGKLLQVQAQP